MNTENNSPPEIQEKKDAFSWEKAVKNSFKWDSQDWYYVLLTLILLTGVFLYHQDMSTCKTTIQELNSCCLSGIPNSYHNPDLKVINLTNITFYKEMTLNVTQSSDN